MKTISIAIDGPSGAGKSTLARSIAAKLEYLYVDTGAIYRTIGLYALENGIDPKDEAAVTATLPNIQVGLEYGADGLQHMLLNGRDVTKDIRLPDVVHRLGEHVLIQRFFVQHDVRPYDAAAAAAGQSLAVVHLVCGKGLAAAGAIGPQDASVQLQHLFASGGLMESVDVLGDHSRQFSRGFPLRQLAVGGVGLCFRAEHFRPVEAEELPGVAFIKGMA